MVAIVLIKKALADNKGQLFVIIIHALCHMSLPIWNITGGFIIWYCGYSPHCAPYNIISTQIMTNMIKYTCLVIKSILQTSVHKKITGTRHPYFWCESDFVTSFHSSQCMAKKNIFHLHHNGKHLISFSSHIVQFCVLSYKARFIGPCDWRLSSLSIIWWISTGRLPLHGLCQLPLLNRKIS